MLANARSRGMFLVAFSVLLLATADAESLCTEPLIIGYVRDAASKATVDNALVTLTPGGATRNTSDFIPGYFGFPVSGGTYTITVSASPYLTASATVSISSGCNVVVQHDFALVFSAGGVLSGHVRDATTNAPMAGALVHIEPGGFTRTTDATGAYARLVAPGPYTLTVSALDYVQSSSGVVVTDGGTTAHDVPLTPVAFTQAVHDSRLGVPACGNAATGCDTGPLLVGADSRVGGLEPNQPNTVFNSCADGPGGGFHPDTGLGGSIDRIRVSTVDGGRFAPGETITITVTAWGQLGISGVELFYASNASTPNWTHLATLRPLNRGSFTWAVSYVVPPAAGLHAVRAGYRQDIYASIPGLCSNIQTSGDPDWSTYDENDDLVFRVGSGRPDDFDGDAKADLAIFRPSIGGWFVRSSSQSYNVASASLYQWGLPGDVPVAGDFDGDGKTDLAVFRPATGQWFIRYSSRNYDPTTPGVYQWGLPGDIPIAADLDGDFKNDLVVYRPSIGGWFIRDSGDNYSVASASFYQWGLPGDVPAARDFDGDGRTELTVFRPATGQWFIRYSSQNYSSSFGLYQWGLPEDVVINP